jgi:hypothetical protein
MPEVMSNGPQIGMKKAAFTKMLMERTDLTFPKMSLFETTEKVVN